MKAKSSSGLYILLLLYAAASLTYYAAGVAALRQEWFHSAQHPRLPFDLADDGQTLTEIGEEAREAGLDKGDVLDSIGGNAYRGRAQFISETRRKKPGAEMDLRVITHTGQSKTARVRLRPMEGPNFSLGGYIAILTPILLVPLVGLVVGYWVVAARPRDPNAWLVLVILSATETVFGNLDWTFWPGIWYVLLGLWSLTLQILVFPALLWFGMYFPERWRFDRRWPWVKWLITAISLLGFLLNVLFGDVANFHVNRARSIMPADAWVDRITGICMVICIVAFLAAIFDKLRSASTPDARRRLRVLAGGSAVSLGGLLIIYGVLPRLGYPPQRLPWLFEIAVPFFVIFPLTLAYVVVVQRAMDVRILLRMGTKYALAKATLLVLQFAIAALLVFRVILPMMQRKQHEAVNLVLIAALVGLLIRMFAARDSVSNRLQRWLDRRFFREAYDAEVVLSELSEHAQKFTDKGPLIETVSRRISQVLHVPQIAVWLRGSQVFQLEEAIGIHAASPVALSETSATVQNLIRTNRPATIYRDRPDEWLAQASVEERTVLDEVNAELLLPLPGRKRLMGMMALGPKKSEEPYTPTDLHVLQSVATQTGLALEVSDLAHSLAREAAQRERINREIEIAREVQQRLFPQRLPQVPGLSLAGLCRPALGVGGDYYDVIELEGGQLGLAIGDVSGKGISAALLMASLRASLRGMTLDGPSDLARTMARVNRLVYEASAHNRYATFFFATYNPAARELRYVNAGHNSPLLLRHEGNETLRLEAGGLVVGLFDQAQYQEEVVNLRPGDVLLAYTDGISEAITNDDEEFGEERMLSAGKAASGGSAEEILQAVFRAADEFTSGAPQQDDMTILIMKLEV